MQLKNKRDITHFYPLNTCAFKDVTIQIIPNEQGYRFRQIHNLNALAHLFK